MSRLLGTIAWVGLAAAALGACRSETTSGATAPGPDPMLAEMGAEVFQRRCASCHGEGGRGDGPVAGALRVPPADLTRIAARRGGSFPRGEIARFIDGRFSLPAHGSREMPVWGERLGENVPEAGVSEEVVRGQIGVVVEYLETLQRTD